MWTKDQRQTNACTFMFWTVFKVKKKQQSSNISRRWATAFSTFTFGFSFDYSVTLCLNKESCLGAVLASAHICFFKFPHKEHQRLWEQRTSLKSDKSRYEAAAGGCSHELEYVWLYTHRVKAGVRDGRSCQPKAFWCLLLQNIHLVNISGVSDLRMTDKMFWLEMYLLPCTSSNIH